MGIIRFYGKIERTREREMDEENMKRLRGDRWMDEELPCGIREKKIERNKHALCVFFLASLKASKSLEKKKNVAASTAEILFWCRARIMRLR